MKKFLGLPLVLVASAISYIDCYKIQLDPWPNIDPDNYSCPYKKKKVYEYGAEESTTTTGMGLSFYCAEDTGTTIIVRNPDFTVGQNGPGQLIIYVEPKKMINIPLNIYKKTSITFLESGDTYTFTPGKTIYVKHKQKNDIDLLYPQSGPFFGTRGITNACFDKSNNVEIEDIIYVVGK